MFAVPAISSVINKYDVKFQLVFISWLSHKLEKNTGDGCS